MRTKAFSRLRAAATREFSYNPDARRLFKHGFTQGWEARDEIGTVLPAKVTYVPPLAKEATKDAKPISILFAWLFRHAGHDVLPAIVTRKRGDELHMHCTNCRRSR